MFICLSSILIMKKNITIYLLIGVFLLVGMMKGNAKTFLQDMATVHLSLSSDFLEDSFKLKHLDYEPIMFSLTMPLMNHFTLKPIGEPRVTNLGLLGVTGIAEYHYKRNRYFSLSVSLMNGGDGKKSSRSDVTRYVESIGSLSLSLMHHNIMRKYFFGYGVNFSANAWSISRNIQRARSVIPVDRSENSQTYGLVANIYTHFIRSIYCGIIYRPSFLRVAPKVELKYEHSISLDVLIRLR